MRHWLCCGCLSGKRVFHALPAVVVADLTVLKFSEHVRFLIEFVFGGGEFMVRLVDDLGNALQRIELSSSFTPEVIRLRRASRQALNVKAGCVFEVAGDGRFVLRVCVQPPLTKVCLLYTSPSPRDRQKSRMPSSA